MMWARVKLIPSSASRSMFGVNTSSFPNACIVLNRWSSVKRKIIFGREEGSSSPFHVLQPVIPVSRKQITNPTKMMEKPDLILFIYNGR
jgi:hypothetical protein